MCPDIRGRPSDHPQPLRNFLFTWSLQTAFCHLPAEVVLRPFSGAASGPEPHGASALGSFWFPRGQCQEATDRAPLLEQQFSLPSSLQEIGKTLGFGKKSFPSHESSEISCFLLRMWFFFFLCKLPTLFSWIYALGSKGLGVLEAASAFCCAATLL